MTGFGFLSFKGERGPNGNKTGDREKMISCYESPGESRRGKIHGVQ